MPELAPGTPAGTPDAILMPSGWVDPAVGHANGRVHHILDALEPILGGGPGRRGHIRGLAGQTERFVALDPEATLLHPTGHPLEKFPRYDWYPQPNGLSYGFLKDAPSPVAKSA